jgi:hypothetical protein
MKVERIVIQACCNKKQIVFRLDRPLDQSFIDVLKSNGFTVNDNFTKAGMLYADNPDLIVSGPFGNNKINAKCKNADCEQKLNDFEALLNRTG